MEIADAMAFNGMKELGQSHCYSGLMPVIEYVKSKGFKFVLVSDQFQRKLIECPALHQCMHCIQTPCAHNIDYIANYIMPFYTPQYTDAGIYTCSQGGRDHKIPGSYSYYEQDAQTYSKWGVECEQK